MNTKGLTEYQRKCLHDWLVMQVAPQEHDRLWPLVEASVGRIAANKLRSQNAWMEAEGLDVSDPLYGDMSVRLEMMSADAYDHVLDWLRASLITEAAWLRNIDEQGRPRKLLKCSRYDDLVREADKSMDRLNAQRAKALCPDDEEHVADLAEGFRLVRLLTPEALDLESSRMKHCVGHGAYDAGVADGSIEIYSMRDPLGRPVITVEIERDTDGLDDYGVLAAKPRTYRAIGQIQGRRNADPSREHLEILRPFAMKDGWTDTEHWWPTVTDAAGVRYDINAIPPGTVFEKFYLSLDAVTSGRAKLPHGITVIGDCYVSGPLVGALPEGMTVGGNLLLNPADDDYVTLPDSLQVGGKVILWDSSRVIAPKHLRDRIESEGLHIRPGTDGGLKVTQLLQASACAFYRCHMDDDDDPVPAPSP